VPAGSAQFPTSKVSEIFKNCVKTYDVAWNHSVGFTLSEFLEVQKIDEWSK
jgi:hypothetical protein